MSRRLKWFALSLALVFGYGTAAVAQERAPLRLQRLVAPITLDGIPDEAAWQQIAPLPLTMYAPVFRGTPTQRTEIRVAYDDENFYAAGWFYDTDPQRHPRQLALPRPLERRRRVRHLHRRVQRQPQRQVVRHHPGGHALRRPGVRRRRHAQTTAGTRSGTRRRASPTRAGSPRCAFRSRASASRQSDGKAVMGLTVTRLVSRLNERVTFPDIDPKFEFRQPVASRRMWCCTACAARSRSTSRRTR